MRKIPKFLQKPSLSWTDTGGMRRACKVLDLQASVLRKQGDAKSADELKRVSYAINCAIGASGVGEAVSLQWTLDEKKESSNG